MKRCSPLPYLLLGFLLLLSPNKSFTQTQTQTQPQTQPGIPQPDVRYKADILVVVAHPDDDTAASTYLAKAVFDEHKRVAVIFTNRGNSGPNAVGMEQSKALSAVREIEARRSLAARGITNVWFLDGVDTPTQDVLHSLETLGHGAALEAVVRLTRLTRPEVILTWLPAYVAGENHGDHQAASVVATEAFDLADDPTAFPEQLTPPRAHSGTGNYGEGLLPWQPKKIYYFSDASHPAFLEGHGPTYLATDISPSKKLSFSEINRQAWQQYATQLDFDEKTLRYFTDAPEYFILGKSLIPAETKPDVWSGIGEKATAKPQPREAQPAAMEPSLELAGPWLFYRQFYKAHSLVALESLVPPQTALGTDRQLWVPLLLRNASSSTVDMSLAANLPKGWKEFTGSGTYHLEPGQIYPVQVFLEAPPDSPDLKSPQSLAWTATTEGKLVGKIDLSVYLEFDGVGQ